MSVPRFLADEDLRFEIVLAVRRMEPLLEIATVQELGLRATKDADLLNDAAEAGLLIVSHDVTTLKAEAERRIADGRGVAGVFLVPQFQPTLSIAESIVLIANASDHDEWANRIVYLPFK